MVRVFADHLGRPLSSFRPARSSGVPGTPSDTMHAALGSEQQMKSHPAALVQHAASDAVDLRQWRSLCRAYILIDYATLLARRSGRRAWTQAGRRALGIVVGLGAMGSPGALAVWVLNDVFVALMVVLTITMALVGSAVLERSALIVSPRDFGILGFRPVNSATYFAVRVSTVMVHTLEVAVLSSAIPLGVLILRKDVTGGMFIASCIAIALATVSTTLFLVAVQSVVLRLATGAQRDWSSPVQMLAGLIYVLAVVVALWMAASHIDVSSLVGTPDLIPTWMALPRWVLWLPPAWFGSYIAIAQGTAVTFQYVEVALSVVLVLVLASALKRNVAAQYSAQLRDSAPDRRGRPVRLWVPDSVTAERRAVWLLTCSQFRHNAQFRQRLFTLGALVLGLGFIALRHHDLTPGSRAGIVGLSSLQVTLAVAMLRLLSVFRVSAGPRGVMWPFLVSPALPAHLVTTTRDIVALFVLVPAVALIATVLSLQIGAIDASIQALTLAGIAHIMLQIEVIVNPVVPFTLTSPPTVIWRLAAFLPWIVGMTIFTIVQQLSRGSGQLLLGCALIWMVSVVVRRSVPRCIATRTAVACRDGACEVS